MKNKNRIILTPYIVDCIVAIRLELYNLGVPCGPEFIQRRMREYGLPPPLPAASTVARVLRQKCLTHQRTGFYPGDYQQES